LVLFQEPTKNAHFIGENQNKPETRTGTVRNRKKDRNYHNLYNYSPIR